MESPFAPFRLGPGEGGCLSAHGPLTFATARSARLAGLEVLRLASTATCIDCAGVTSADSAGLAVLLDWLAAARLAGRSLKLTNLPQDLTALGRISEVDQLLASGV